METVLVIGSTGLAGSNVVDLAIKKGYKVRALVRSKTDIEALEKAGAELVIGDLADPRSVDQAMKGADYVVNGAAQIGGTWSKATWDDFVRVNQQGAINVVSAAECAGIKRTVMMLTPAIFDRTNTQTEKSPMLGISPTNSPYQKTKLAAFYEAMARAARGQDIVFSVPGAIYGPAPVFNRAVVPTSFNSTLLNALSGELKIYLKHVNTWAFAPDVARVTLLAMEKGTLGRCYLAYGRDDENLSLPDFCNRFLELAQSERRVKSLEVDTATPEELAAFGSIGINYAKAVYPMPLADTSITQKELDFQATSINDGLKQTLDWFKAHGKA